MATVVAGRVAAYASTAPSGAPSSHAWAIPQTSHGKPIQLTPVPVNVNVAVAPAVGAATTVPSLDFTPVELSVKVAHPPAGARIAALSSKRVTRRARTCVTALYAFRYPAPTSCSP